MPLTNYLQPALGPVISGFLELTENWRWNFYVILWLAGGTAILMFTIPETLPSAVLLNKARRIRRAQLPGYENVLTPAEASGHTLTEIFKIALTRPWIILFDPISFLVAIYLSVVYTLLYMLFTIYPIVFQQKRGWNSGLGELPLIGSIVGALFGGSLIILNATRERKKLAQGWVRCPEDRLPLGMLGGVLFPVTMFWFAWSGEYNNVHWMVVVLAGVFLSASITLIFVSFLNYLTDTYISYAASALAANTVARSACGAAAPLFTQYMFDTLGVGGGGSLIGGVAVVLAIIPFTFYRYGEAIRKRSRFAPTEEIRRSEHHDEESGGRQDETIEISVSDSASNSLTAHTDVSRPVSPVDVEKEESEKIDEAGLEAFEKEPQNENREVPPNNLQKES